MSDHPTLKIQTWADDLRLPCLPVPEETAKLLYDSEPYRRPPVPFQSKHLPALKRNVWFALRRPACRTRPGLLWIWPARRCCVYISADTGGKKGPRVALLRLRIDPQFVSPGTGPTVFAATLSAVARRLWIEDTLLWKGRPLQDSEPFQDRWARATRWIEHYCVQDARLLSGLVVEPAAWQPLVDIQPEGTWELQCADHDCRRLLWIANHTESVAASPVIGAAPGAAAGVPDLELSGPCVAVATRAAGPDQWALSSADGIPISRALIRTLTVSSELRSTKQNTVRVEVVWRPEFGKWEILGLTTDVARHSSVFTAISENSPPK